MLKVTEQLGRPSFQRHYKSRRQSALSANFQSGLEGVLALCDLKFTCLSKESNTVIDLLFLKNVLFVVFIELMDSALPRDYMVAVVSSELPRKMFSCI